MKIISATSPELLQVAAELFREYQTFLDVDLCFQGFEQELASLPGKYATPKGTILLAQQDQLIVGCVAVRPLEGDTCEMKRLYVKDDFRGLSIGETLVVAIIKQAKKLGYQRMRLDTLQTLKSALGLYQKLGFREIKPYNENPLGEVVYLELEFDSLSLSFPESDFRD